MRLLEELEAAGERCSPGIRTAFVALEDENRGLKAQVERLGAKLRELERRLGLNSTNSSRPPSTDPPGTARRTKPKKGGKRKRGAQPGHAQHRRALLGPERVDTFEDHWPEVCSECGHALTPADETGRAERRQVLELPPLHVDVTEHRLHRCRCPECEEVSHAASPPGVGPETTFGPRLVGLCAAVTVRLRASRRNLRRLLGDLLDVEAPCVGKLQALLEETSAALLPVYREVRAVMRRSPAVGADETGWWLRKVRYWLWVAATPAYSYYRCGRRRSARERERLLGKDFGGVVTSDRYGAYNALPAERRQLCWAHLRRDFVAWSERGGAVGRLGAWGVAECDRMFTLWHRFREGAVTRDEMRRGLGPLQARMTRLLYRAYHAGDPKMRRFADQLMAKWPALWSFAEHEGVEPTNNEAERSLRGAVIWKKTSFGNNSGRGLRMTERLLTVAETARKQEQDLLEYLTTVITAYRSGHAAPALLSNA